MADIKTVAVIGGGVEARSIAYAAARSGYRTILENILPASLRRAQDEMRGALHQAVHLGQVSSADADCAFRRLEYASTIEEAARRADLVIEAVPDEMESKLEIFTLLDKICRPHTIIASTAASQSVSEIASVTYRAQNILGMRFPLPVTDKKHLELVRGRETDDKTIAACAEVGRRLGLTVVVIVDAAPDRSRS